MILAILRALFVLLMAAVGWFFIIDPRQPFGGFPELAMAIALVVAVLCICIDILSPRKKLAVFSGTFLGLLVGVAMAYAASFIVQLVIDRFLAPLDPTAINYRSAQAYREAIIHFINLIVGIVCCYLAISFILQTKDDFRFIIPYVEFSKQTRGARPYLLDTSVLIDGRIADIVETGIIESQIVVPRFVLAELQAVADSADKLKRNRGRRGLDVLAKLQGNKRTEVHIYETGREHDRSRDVDELLLELAKELGGRVLTNDFNLNKVAQLRGVDVVNTNDLANALKPEALPGEKMVVRLVKPGEEAGQGVGYLSDGTMVVVEHGRSRINQDVEFLVTNTRQTSAGRMIFGRMVDGDGATSAEAVAEAGIPTPTPPHQRGGRGNRHRHEPRPPSPAA